MTDAEDQSKGTGSSNPLGALIDAEVAREEARRQDFRTRSVSLLGVSSGTLAISTGLLAIADKAESSAYILTSATKSVVIAAVAALVISACLALWVNASAHDYAVSRVRMLSEFVEAKWDEPDLARFVANLDIDYLGRLRASNEKKKWFFDLSIGFQVLGVALIAATALAILTSST